MLPASELVALAALVRDSHRRLLQDQAGIGIVDVDAGSILVRHQRVVVHLEVVSEERQAKSAAPLERPVTCPAVAAELAQQGHDVALERGRFLDDGSREPAGNRRQGLLIFALGKSDGAASRRSDTGGRPAQGETG